MTIIPEDGSGLPLANSYASIELISDYHAIRGNADWANATAAEKISAAIRATDYIEATYEASRGPLSALQALQWPQVGDWRLNAAVISACALLALYALKGPLTSPSERGIKSKSQELEGVGKTQTVYDDVDGSDPYPMITAMLASLADIRGAATIRIGRLTR